MHVLHTRAVRRRAAMRGVAAVEFALLLLPMMIMAFGVVEYGRALYQYNAVAKASRDAVRLLSQNSPLDADYANVQTEARCLVVHGNRECDGDALAPGLATGHVQICDRVNWANCAGSTPANYLNVSTGMGLINLVEVRIASYAFSYLGLPFVSTAASIVFGDISTTMRQIV